MEKVSLPTGLQSLTIGAYFGDGESADRPARPHSQRLLKEKVSLPTGVQGFTDGAYF